MPLVTLPNELVLHIALYLDTRSLSRFSRISWRYRNVVRDELHKVAIADRPRDVRSWKGELLYMPALEWAVGKSKIELLRYLLDHNITGIKEDGTWLAYDHATLGACAGEYDLPDITTLFIHKAFELGRMSPSEATRILRNILHYWSFRSTSPEYRIKYIGDVITRGVKRSDPDQSKTLKLIDLLLSTYAANPTGFGANGEIVQPFLHMTRDTRVFERLIEYGADLSCRDLKGYPILHHAIKNLCEPAVKSRHNADSTFLSMLLDAGADPTISVPHRTRSGPLISILALAIESERYSTATKLLDIGITTHLGLPYTLDEGSRLVETTLLCETLRSHNSDQKSRLKLIQQLLDGGEDPNRSRKKYDEEESPLDAAIRSLSSTPDGGVAEVTLLLDHGADPDKQDQKGRNFMQRNTQTAAQKAWIWKKRLTILTKVAMEMHYPSLLPGDQALEAIELILPEAQDQLQEARRLPPADEDIERFGIQCRPPFSKGPDLKDCWELLRLLAEGYQQYVGDDQVDTAWRLHHFRKEYGAEIEDILMRKLPV